MKSITRRNVVAVALRLLSVALLLGAVAVDGFLIASVVGPGGNINWGSFVALFPFFSVVPLFGAIAAWEAAGRVLAGGQASIQRGTPRHVHIDQARGMATNERLQAHSSHVQ